MKKVRVGLVGTGGICNGAHIPGYLQCEDCEITAICDISEEALNRTGDRLNLPADRRFRDYRDLIASGLVNAVDVTTSNDVHVEIALAALEAGLPVSVEKPIGMNFEESLQLLKKSEETGLPVFVCFSWRYRDFVRYMRTLIEQGEIGEIYHMYFYNIKESGLWKGRRLEWRFQEERASSGVLCDLGSHLFDMIRFFGQEVKAVYCDRGIIVHRRQKLDSDDYADVTTDDWANALCMLENGREATVKLTRCATTNKDSLELYIIGSKGSLKFVYENGPSKLLRCVGDDITTNTFREVEIPKENAGAVQSISFINLLLGKPDDYAATIQDGIYSQAIVDGAKLSSLTGRQIKISEMFESESEKGEK
ncbi:MAG: Gfo/Idh/MocA family protein [Christensenellales bacterium]|jgi:predicted dehydrogenase